MAECSRCGKPGVHKLPNEVLCKDHFLDYFENKVYKTIKKYKLIDPTDRVCIATSGGKDSLAVLYATSQYCKKYNIEHYALAIDEGIADYRAHTLEDLRDFCGKYDVKLYVASFKDSFGKPLDDLVEDAMKKHNKKPCTVCGILRRTLLNHYAKKLGSTKIATGHNLDDEVQAVLMNQILGSAAHNASLGPITGLNTKSEFVTRIKPLYLISEKETRLFALLKGFKVHFSECPNISHSFRAAVRDHLSQIEDIRPGAKNGIINCFLETLPLLKEHFKQEKNQKFTHCERCGSPASSKVCNACKLIEELDLKWNPELELS